MKLWSITAFFGCVAIVCLEARRHDEDRGAIPGSPVEPKVGHSHDSVLVESGKVSNVGHTRGGHVRKHSRGSPDELRGEQTKPSGKRRRILHQNFANTSSSQVEHATVCSKIKCARNESCIVNLSTQEPMCIAKISLKPSKGLKAKGKQERIHPGKQNAKAPKGIDVRERAQRMKEQARDFEVQYQRNRKSKLLHATSEASSAHETANDSPAPAMPRESTAHLRSKHHAVGSQPTTGTTPECPQEVFDKIGVQLLDSFKALQDSDNTRRPKKVKRNSTKKELHEDDECICQAPVSWQFQRLDVSTDGRLSQSELRQTGVKAGHQAKCVDAFYARCDRDSDDKLSEKEWCCCFADVLPPCVKAMQKVPSMLVRGSPVVLIGAYRPQCDDDGFFSRVQCHGSTGKCWCSDRSGNEIKGNIEDNCA